MKIEIRLQYPYWCIKKVKGKQYSCPLVFNSVVGFGTNRDQGCTCGFWEKTMPVYEEIENKKRPIKCIKEKGK